MLVPGKPANETARVQALHGLELLDSAPEERFDRLTRLAKRLFNVPIALVTLVDTNRQWFKSCVGLDATETPRDVSFCGHAILQNEDTLEVIHDPYVETEKYVADAYAKTSSTSKQSGKNIVFYSCLEIYNSPAFDAFIKSQDQYLQN